MPKRTREPAHSPSPSLSSHSGMSVESLCDPPDTATLRPILEQDNAHNNLTLIHPRFSDNYFGHDMPPLSPIALARDDSPFLFNAPAFAPEACDGPPPLSSSWFLPPAPAAPVDTQCKPRTPWLKVVCEAPEEQNTIEALLDPSFEYKFNLIRYAIDAAKPGYIPDPSRHLETELDYQIANLAAHRKRSQAQAEAYVASHVAQGHAQAYASKVAAAAQRRAPMGLSASAQGAAAGHSAELEPKRMRMSASQGPAQVATNSINNAAAASRIGSAHYFKENVAPGGAAMFTLASDEGRY